MQKEVQRFLRNNGYVIPQSHRTLINRVGVCWFVKSNAWGIASILFQTVTVREHLLLEVIHDCPERDSYLLKETLPLAASAKVLQIRLKVMAESASRQYIRDLASDNFWEDNVRENLEMLSPEVRESLTSEVEQFHRDSKELRFLLNKKANILDLIEQHDKLKLFDDRLTQLRLSD